MNEDEKQLDLISIFHYVLAGLTALFACIPIVHVTIGIAMISGAFDGTNGPPAVFGLIFIVMGSFFIICGWALAVAMLIAAGKLKRRVSRSYCMILGGIECVFMPFGTILGVFTIIILMRDSVKQLFETGDHRESAGVLR